MSTLTGTPYGQTETGAAYTEAARIAEANHPARLLGIAQRAIETAARMDNPAEMKQVLDSALARITPPAVTA